MSIDYFEMAEDTYYKEVSFSKEDIEEAIEEFRTQEENLYI